MEDKLKVYKTFVEQSFDFCWYSYKWFKRTLNTKRYTSEEENIRYILAKNKEEAIQKYKERYYWKFDQPLTYLWNWDGRNEMGWISDNPNFEHIVKAYVAHPTFNKLKDELRADELLAFCKQEMYPVEVLIK